jgi:5-methylthioadenosine/S-adenosylhomocysteine deaminase
LHNHLPYDILSLWPVPRKFTNRGQWSSSSTPQYHQLISGPMGVLGRDPDVVPAVVRFVETRCLLAGTTTSQGVALASAPGIVTHFRGLVRNIESTGDPQLPAATTHIADIDATDAEHFLARISGTQKLVLHLAEGIDDTARNHFLALHLGSGDWAITGNLIGIHCAALHADDFAVMAVHNGSMVWSPLSNLLLYGATADIGAAIGSGITIALGSDWAPSGSKNLLDELKVARIAAGHAQAQLSSQDLLAMVTTSPARMLGWQDHIGSIEAGKRADVVVFGGRTGDPYDAVLTATEADIELVVINGVARSGTINLMSMLGLTGDQVTVAGQPRVLNLAQTTADPAVAALSVAEAVGRLEQALADLPNAATPTLAEAVAMSLNTGQSLLAVEGVIDNHMSSRPHLELNGQLTGPNLPTFTPPALAAGAADTDAFPALTLDPLTTVDNPGFYQALATSIKHPRRHSTSARRVGVGDDR